jgi:cytochrome c-type biogenesis protein CcmH/NrfG
MQRNILISGLTILSVLFVTATSIKAELAPGVDLKIQNIERDADTETEEPQAAPAPTRKRQNSRRNSGQLAVDSQRSIEYVQLGWAEYKKGNERQALIHYYSAIKLDRTNALAFLAAGTLLGETEEGIACMKAAALLFHAQKNQKGYDLATTWLEQHGIAN